MSNGNIGVYDKHKCYYISQTFDLTELTKAFNDGFVYSGYDIIVGWFMLFKKPNDSAAGFKKHEDVASVVNEWKAFYQPNQEV